jgi:hypothetical protein
VSSVVVEEILAPGGALRVVVEPAVERRVPAKGAIRKLTIDEIRKLDLILTKLQHISRSKICLSNCYFIIVTKISFISTQETVLFTS